MPYKDRAIEKVKFQFYYLSMKRISFVACLLVTIGMAVCMELREFTVAMVGSMFIIVVSISFGYMR